MQAIAEGIENQFCPHFISWLKHGEEALEKVKQGHVINPALSFHNQISQMNVLVQMEHIASYPFVRERMQKNQLRLHGWWFDIAQADVYCYEPSVGKFVLIDEQGAQLILQRML